MQLMVTVQRTSERDMDLLCRSRCIIQRILPALSQWLVVLVLTVTFGGSLRTDNDGYFLCFTWDSGAFDRQDSILS